MDEGPLKKLVHQDFVAIALAALVVSLALPAREIGWRVWFGVECFLFASFAPLDPSVWDDIFRLGSPNAQLFWGGVTNILLAGTWVLSRHRFHPGQVGLLALLYAVSLAMVIYCCQEALKIGFYVWIGAHGVMVLGLFISVLSPAACRTES